MVNALISWRAGIKGELQPWKLHLLGPQLGEAGGKFSEAYLAHLSCLNKRI